LIISWNNDAPSTAGKLARQIMSVFSASQNQQNEKESDAVEFLEWWNSKPWSFKSGYTAEDLYKKFKQSKTNPPKEK